MRWSKRSAGLASTSTCGSASTRSNTCAAAAASAPRRPWSGRALRIKPILTFGSEITPVDKVRTKSRALHRMDSYLAQLHEQGATDWIVQHAQSPEDAERMVAKGREIFGSEPLFCTEVGPVLGAHLGAGLLVGGVTATTE